MNGFFKYFKIPLIITAVISIICIVIYANGAGSIDYNRYNQSYDNSQCVYDYAGKLTDEEIQSLNDYLVEVEYANCVDIAYIIINDDETAYLSSVKELAQQVAIDWQMGFDGEGGNTVVFVDNWSRGGDGKIHSWIASRGSRITSRLGESECEDILMVLDEIPNDDADPYNQYYAIAESIYKATKPIHPPFGAGICFIIGAIVAAIYILVNKKSKVADITVNNATYLSGGHAQFPVRRDIFLHKSVSKRKIERDSNSGSGGGGGGGFSGGGHSR